MNSLAIFAIVIDPAEARDWTAIEIVLSIAVLCFGVIIFSLQTFVILKGARYWSAASVLQIYGLTLIVTGAILLVVAGYSSEQMSPVMGLLGAVAGYLLGVSKKTHSSGEQDADDQGTA